MDSLINLLHWDGWIKILQFLTSFSILILVHELGHFLFAKLFGVRVERFYLFFNPWFSLFKFKIGETTYGLGWVPVGGYCRISGMVDETTSAKDLGAEPQRWEYRSRPAWQRLLIIIGGVLMNILLAVGVYIGITYTWGDSYIKTSDVRAGFEYLEVGQELGFRNGDKILTVGGEPVDNFATIPKILLFDDVQQVVVERAGERVTIPIGDLTQFKRKLIRGQQFFELRYPFVVADVAAGGGAAAAGLLPGDSLTGVDGEPLYWYDEFKTAFAQKKGDTIALGLVRAGREQTLSVPISQAGTIGVYVEQNIARYYPISTREYGFWEAIPVGFVRTFTSIGDYFKQLKLIASPETEAYKSVGGVIAMGNIFPAAWDWAMFWHVTAMLSIMLAVLNILPIPMLDGGHVVFILYEMITKRRPSDKFMEGAQLVGMILVFGIIILANGNDILKLIAD